MWIGSLRSPASRPSPGYYSKDAILEAAWAVGDAVVGTMRFWLGIFAAFLTAFYSWRLCS